jgi:guanylate kinase
VAGILFILSAPSGSGKTTLVSHLRSQVGELDFSISYTTRAPRGAEQEGREYHYVSLETFKEMIERDEFLEWADVFGNYYGTARRSLDQACAHGRDLLLDIDVQGARQVRQRVPDSVSIFILPPNPQVLEGRLRDRSRAEGLLDAAVIQRRLDKARQEIENYPQYGYILVNDVLDLAVEQLLAIVKVERRARSGSDFEDRPGVEDAERLESLARRCRQSEALDLLAPVLASFGLSLAQGARAGS